MTALPELHNSGRQADAEVDSVRHEFKSLDPGADSSTIRNDVNNALRSTGQARNVIINARGSGLTIADAQRGVARVRGISRGKLDTLRIIGDDFDISASGFA